MRLSDNQSHALAKEVEARKKEAIKSNRLVIAKAQKYAAIVKSIPAHLLEILQDSGRYDSLDSNNIADKIVGGEFDGQEFDRLKSRIIVLAMECKDINELKPLLKRL